MQSVPRLLIGAADIEGMRPESLRFYAEHGVGLHKIDMLAQEHGEDALALMRELKKAWDPLNILNPGKVIRLG